MIGRVRPGELWRDRLLTTGAALILGLTLSNVAPADDQSKETKRVANAEYNAAVEKAEADYKAARERCDSLAGNEKDVCVKEAKADQKRAKADAKAMKKSTKAHAEANEEKREAQFQGCHGEMRLHERQRQGCLSEGSRSQVQALSESGSGRRGSSAPLSA